MWLQQCYTLLVSTCATGKGLSTPTHTLNTFKDGAVLIDMVVHVLTREPPYGSVLC